MTRHVRRGTLTGQGEAVAVWALWAAVLLALVVTYARLPLAQLYRVDVDGLGGALGRALVLVNFPIGLVAVALVLVAMGALPARAWWVAAAAIVLCATIVLPGVIDEQDLDARPVNAIPAIGVALALGLTAAAVRRGGTGPAVDRRGDRLRLLVAAVVLLSSLPWIAAELGWHLPQGVFNTTAPRREADGSLLPAVHLGHHHGWDGALLVLSVLLLTRVRPAARGLSTVLSVYLGALGAYGLVNAVQDFWLEQVVKRGWADSEIPGAIRPSLGWIWLVIAGLGAVLAALLVRSRDARLRPG